ncbi:hypothetical protein OUZ56_011324 [Daphnia magna]|uniref:Uncharacterized protein n=1 Tax=Daphnia magna TaxID=35525 RepID=A0ABQ9YZT2_9CRUS|nr:hypothetical protein OUZ56_011324 [Daphnia magna]
MRRDGVKVAASLDISLPSGSRRSREGPSHVYKKACPIFFGPYIRKEVEAAFNNRTRIKNHLLQPHCVKVTIPVPRIKIQTSVCDSSKTDDTFVFLTLQESPLQEKSRSADADVAGMARYCNAIPDR